LSIFFFKLITSSSYKIRQHSDNVK